MDSFAAFVERHWLLLLLAMMLVVTGLPFLAPVLMALGWTSAGTLIYTLYTPFCHQLPQRSWFLFGEKLTYTLDEINRVYPSSDPWQLRFFYGTPEMGWKVAWSDRMLSFYTMTPAFGLVYAALGRWRPHLRPLPLTLFLLSLLPLALDGATHVLSDLVSGISNGGFRDTNTWLALLTGNAFPTFYAGDHLGTFNWWARLLTGLLAAWGIAFFAFPWLNRLFYRQNQPPVRHP
ncbi:MAG: hypothetical protein HY328_02770 [Chloroflexi bacterium]|nr:hypothetical protein [Chloroflexota bacterium]